MSWFAVLASLGTAGAFATANAQASATAILDRVQVNPRRPIDFHAIVLPETVYVGQQATYQVAVMLSPDARSKLRRNPEFLPPELKGLLAYELGTPTRVPARNYAGGVFEAHVFRRALFPVASGAQLVPAPQLTYALPQSSSYFSREERYVVRAESAAFIVKALPLEGRPDDFNGAVGVLRVAARVDTSSARVGDPLVLTLRVQGISNVKLLPRPTIELDWASAVPGSERILVDSSGSLVRGTKEFDWILTPTREGRVRVPRVSYAYFDPYAARYGTAESAPLDLSVRTGALAATVEGEPSALLPLRSLRRPTREVVTWNGGGRPPTEWVWWLLLASIAPIPWLWWSRSGAWRARQNHGQRVRATSGQPAREADQGARGTARITRRALLAALAERFSQSPQSLVSRRHVARVLRRGGVTRSTTQEVLTALDHLDEQGFAAADSVCDTSGSALTSDTSMARRVTELLQRVDAEALPKGRQFVPSAIGAVWFLAVLVSAAPNSSSLRAQNAERQLAPAAPNSTVAVAARGDSARAAYERRAYTQAAERFRALVALQPRAPDLLANWGAAAWAAGDTVHAVMAWQRAARLEPLAVDLQERIDLLPSGARGGVANVAMIPVPWLTRVALGLWLLGWCMLGWMAWYARRPVATQVVNSHRLRWIRRSAITGVALAIVSGGAAFWGMRVLDASTLAVVRRPETMRIVPGTEADALGGVSTGDVVRILQARQDWRLVVHADGRRGWLPAVRLVAIEGDSAVFASDSPLDRLPLEPQMH